MCSKSQSARRGGTLCEDETLRRRKGASILSNIKKFQNYSVVTEETKVALEAGKEALDLLKYFNKLSGVYKKLHGAFKHSQKLRISNREMMIRQNGSSSQPSVGTGLLNSSSDTFYVPQGFRVGDTIFNVAPYYLRDSFKARFPEYK